MAASPIQAPQDWLENRKTYIGGTDIAAVLGLHPYKSAVEVWLEKLGQAKPFEGNSLTRCGNALEDFVAQEFRLATGHEIKPGGGWLRDPKVRYFGGNPDRLIGDDTVLEIKTYGFRATSRWGDEGTDQIPSEYLLQVQWYLMLTGRTKWILAAWAKAEDRLRVFQGERSELLVQTMRAAGERFWLDFVLTGRMPEPDGGDGAAEAIRKLLPDSRPGLEVEATEELAAVANELYELTQADRANYRRKLELQQRLQLAMGEAEAMWLPGWPKPLTWKRCKDTVGVDYKSAFNLLADSLGADDEARQAAEAAATKTLRQGSRTFLAPWSREKASNGDNA